MARCPVCNHCGMCVSKQEAPVEIPYSNGMISIDACLVEEKCAFCATPLDILYD